METSNSLTNQAKVQRATQCERAIRADLDLALASFGLGETVATSEVVRVVEDRLILMENSLQETLIELCPYHTTKGNKKSGSNRGIRNNYLLNATLLDINYLLQHRMQLVSLFRVCCEASKDEKRVDVRAVEAALREVKIDSLLEQFPYPAEVLGDAGQIDSRIGERIAEIQRGGDFIAYVSAVVQASLDLGLKLPGECLAKTQRGDMVLPNAIDELLELTADVNHQQKSKLLDLAVNYQHSLATLYYSISHFWREKKRSPRPELSVRLVDHDCVSPSDIVNMAELANSHYRAPYDLDNLRYGYTSKPVTPPGVEAQFSKGAQALILEDGGKFVGALRYFWNPPASCEVPEGSGYIISVGVQPEYARQGGQAPCPVESLYSSLFVRSAFLCRGFYGDAQVLNKPSLDVSQKLGFQVSSLIVRDTPHGKTGFVRGYRSWRAEHALKQTGDIRLVSGGLRRNAPLTASNKLVSASVEHGFCFYFSQGHFASEATVQTRAIVLDHLAKFDEILFFPVGLQLNREAFDSVVGSYAEGKRVGIVTGPQRAFRGSRVAASNDSLVLVESPEEIDSGVPSLEGESVFLRYEPIHLAELDKSNWYSNPSFCERLYLGSALASRGVSVKMVVPTFGRDTLSEVTGWLSSALPVSAVFGFDPRSSRILDIHSALKKYSFILVGDGPLSAGWEEYADLVNERVGAFKVPDLLSIRHHHRGSSRR